MILSSVKEISFSHYEEVTDGKYQISGGARLY